MNRLRFFLLAGVLALVVAALAAGPAAAKGGNTDNVKRCQNGGWANLYNANTGLLFGNQGACIAYGAKGQAYAFLEVVQEFTNCPAQCFGGSLSGFGLAPDTLVEVSSSFGSSSILKTDMNGNLDPENNFINLFCGATDVRATTNTPTGATITSKTVDSPCPPS